MSRKLILYTYTSEKKNKKKKRVTELIGSKLIYVKLS